MPLEERLRHFAQEWLERAKGNLARAKQPKLPEAFWEDYCFDAQQAAEKAIKAMLMKKGIVFPYVHDLARLLTLLEEAGETIPESVRQAEDLTRYAVVTRYPGLTEPVTEAHYQEAVASAEAVVQWVEKKIA